MIKVTRLNKSVLYVNEDLIEFIEETPDTVITLNTGVKIIVTEKIDVIINEIIAFRKRVFNGDTRLITENAIEGEKK